MPAATALLANSIAILTLSVGCIMFGSWPTVSVPAGCWRQAASHSVPPRGAVPADGRIDRTYQCPVCAVRFFCRRNRRGAEYRGEGLSAGGAFFRPVVCYNVAYAIFGGLTPVLVRR